MKRWKQELWMDYSLISEWINGTFLVRAYGKDVTSKGMSKLRATAVTGDGALVSFGDQEFENRRKMWLRIKSLFGE